MKISERLEKMEKIHAERVIKTERFILENGLSFPVTDPLDHLFRHGLNTSAGMIAGYQRPKVEAPDALSLSIWETIDKTISDLRQEDKPLLSMFL